jgi:hypothetical protein
MTKAAARYPRTSLSSLWRGDTERHVLSSSSSPRQAIPKQEFVSEITLPLIENQTTKLSGGGGVMGTRQRVNYLLQHRGRLLATTEFIHDEGGGSLSTPLPLPRLAKSKVTSHAHTARGLWQWTHIYRGRLERNDRHNENIRLLLLCFYLYKMNG